MQYAPTMMRRLSGMRNARRPWRIPDSLVQRGSRITDPLAWYCEVSLIDRITRWRVFLGILLCVVLATLRGPVAVATGLLDEAPTIAPFGTAHVRIEGAVNNQGQELPVQGDGDIDAAHGASHLTVGVLGAVFETIVLNGRTYTR